MKKNSWENSSAIIVMHELTTGPGHDLRDYLLQHHIDRLLFITHPLLYITEGYKKSSRYELYKKGKLVKKGVAVHWNFPEPMLYCKDILYTIIWSIRFIGKCDVFFGISNLNAYCGLVYKSLGFTDKSIFYVIDYVPIRFKNKFLNGIYHHIEKNCAEKSDWTWNLSPRMIEAREKKWGKQFPHQLVVPHGVHLERIKRLPFIKTNRYEILYMGSLLKKQGIQLVIESLPDIMMRNPHIRLTIIGKGPYEAELRALVRRMNVQEHVDFLGYIESHEEMENRIAKAAVAIALYDKQYDEFSYYADPGKIKNYLGAGVPVIMTDVPLIAQQVEKAECGFIVEYSKEDLQKILSKYFSDEKLIEKYKKNALVFARKYSWNKIYQHALSYSFL